MAVRKTKDQESGQTIEQETADQESGQPAGREAAGQETDMFDTLPNPCVYCGPSVRGVARQYTTYMGGIPDPLKEFIREHPAARALLVGTARFAGVRKRLETPGTAEAVVYKKIKSEL